MPPKTPLQSQDPPKSKAGRHRRFIEETHRVVTLVPLSRVREFRRLAQHELARYEEDEQAALAANAPQDSK